MHNQFLKFRIRKKPQSNALARKTFELNMKKAYIRYSPVILIVSEAYFTLCQTSVTEIFCENM